MNNNGIKLKLIILVLSMLFKDPTLAHVVLAGGKGRVGLGILKNLVLNSFNVTLLSRNESKNTEDLECHSGSINEIKCDLTKQDELSSAIDCCKEISPISAFINSSGFRPSVNNKNITLEEWEESILVNSLLLHLPTRNFTNYFLENKIKGSIVTISSIYGLVAPTFNIYNETPYTTEPDYAYNKAAAIGYMRYMASLYAEHEIRFNTVCPGGIFSNQDPNFVKNYTSNIPIRKMADSSDLGGIVSFLCSPNSSYITGTAIPVDGGWTAQ